MEAMTLTEMREYASDILVNSESMPRVHNTFKIQIETGCRAGETIISRWENFENGITVLQTLKNNYPRNFITEELNPIFVYNISLQNAAYFLNSYSTMIMYLERFRPYKTYIGGKECDIHFFRHLYAKNLKDLGYTDTQIQEILGERHLASALNYIYSTVYKE